MEVFTCATGRGDRSYGGYLLVKKRRVGAF
jgi:hypothetical protein